MTVFSNANLAEACSRFGPSLQLIAGIDGARLLWALAGCESSFGRNCVPRHEPYYHDMATAKPVLNPRLVHLTELYGCAAHSSFGPWQLLLLNTPDGTHPQFFDELAQAARLTVEFINDHVIRAKGATSIAQIAATYNSGCSNLGKMSSGVHRYVDQCEAYYEHAVMPEVQVV